jgi:hypothetical protein
LGAAGGGGRRIGQNGWKRRESGVGRQECLVLGIGFLLGFRKEFGGGFTILGFLLEFVAIALLVFGKLGHLQLGELHVGADGANGFEEVDVLGLEGFLHEAGQGHLAEVVEFDFQQGRVGFLLLEGEDGFVELVQGIGDVPPGVEAGEGGGGGVDAELFFEEFEGLGLGAGFEVSLFLILNLRFAIFGSATSGCFCVWRGTWRGAPQKDANGAKRFDPRIGRMGAN